MQTPQGQKLSLNLSHSSVAPLKKTKLKGSSIFGQDFYRLAASMAKIDYETENGRGIEHEVLQEFRASPFLELSYQEKSHIFQAAGKRWPNLLSPAFFMFDQLPNIQDKDELASQLENLAPILWEKIGKVEDYTAPRMTALEFHEQLTAYLEGGKKPFVLLAHNSAGNEYLLIDKARLFSSNRLISKASQLGGGADPSIRYFHAALHSSAHNKKTHVLYWLQLQEQTPVVGGFLDDAEVKVPKKIIHVYEALRDLYLSYKESGDKQNQNFVLLKRYFQANQDI